MEGMTYNEAIHCGAKKLNELHYLLDFTGSMSYIDGITKGFYMALAMVYGETVQHIESVIEEQ